MSLILITPHTGYGQEFTAMAADYHAHHEWSKYESFRPALEDFPVYVRSKLDESEGIGLQSGYVRATTYWLTDEHRTIYGTIRYRPVLNADLSKVGIGFDVVPAHRKKGYGTIMPGLVLKKDR